MYAPVSQNKKKMNYVPGIRKISYPPEISSIIQNVKTRRI